MSYTLKTAMLFTRKQGHNLLGDDVSLSSYGAINERYLYRSEKSLKDLKLSIIYGPLYPLNKNKNTICCICCRDMMGELSIEERVIVLACGFSRECSSKIIPPIIVDLCVSYIGSHKVFFGSVLKSFAEDRQSKRLRVLEQFETKCRQQCEKCCQAILPCYHWTGFCKCSVTFQCCTDYRCCWGYCYDIMAAILILIFMLMTIGKDIIALATAEKCNITGNNSIQFNVYEWILIGSVTDISISIITAICCLLLVFTTKKDVLKACMAMECIMILIWSFFIVHIVNGFLLYEEMISDNRISNYCMNILLSWNILQLIPTISVICVSFIIFVGAMGKNFLSFVGLTVSFGLFFGKDIASIVIATNNNCNTINGVSKYIQIFNVTEWMYIGSSLHLAALIISCIIFRKIAYTFFWSGYLFIICWTIIGFLFYDEIATDTYSDWQCSNAVLSWCIIEIIETLCYLCLLSLN
eukprot:58247_1